jgi:hypothetical protein
VKSLIKPYYQEEEEEEEEERSKFKPCQQEEHRFWF